MAVRIGSRKGSFDQFKTKCPHCGVELEYTRTDIQPHRRWKNGFFYCPRCKNPVGHEESNLVQSGEEFLRSLPKEKIEESLKYANQNKVLRILRNIFIPVGLASLIFGTVAFSILMVNYGNTLGYYVGLIVCFTGGIALLIAARVFKTMIINRRKRIFSNK